jgi:hypothetical protein
VTCIIKHYSREKKSKLHREVNGYVTFLVFCLLSFNP